MATAVTFVLNVITSAVNWLGSWQFLGIPFLYYMIGIAVIGILMRFAL